MKNILTALEADKETSNFEEKEVAIITGIAEAFERRQKDKLLALRDVPKKKLLEETAKVDKVLSKFKNTELQRLMNSFMQELFRSYCYK